MSSPYDIPERYFRAKRAIRWRDPNRKSMEKTICAVGDLLKLLGSVNGKLCLHVADGPRAGHRVLLNRDDMTELSPLELLALQAD